MPHRALINNSVFLFAGLSSGLNSHLLFIMWPFILYPKYTCNNPLFILVLDKYPSFRISVSKSTNNDFLSKSLEKL